MPKLQAECTVVFDSNISKVEIYTDNEFTTLLTTISSSNTSFGSALGDTLYFKVYLSQTYEIDNVSSSAPLISIQKLTSNTFDIWVRSDCTITITSKTSEIVVNSTTLETTLHTAGKYCDKNILVKSSDSNLIAENIKKDVSVFGVTGSYEGTNVSDTTATQGDVLSGKYFYGSDGVKTEGTMTDHTETSITLNTGTGEQYVPAGHYSDILTKLVLNSDAASKIKKDEVILGVTGTFEGGGDQPQLNAPTISIAGTTLSIEDPATNGNFTVGWKLYDNGAYVDQFLTAVIQLANIQFSTGTHKLTVKSFGTNFKDSAASNEVTYTNQEQLATPQNVTANGTTVSWDEVENATSYEIYADGVSIGTVENESGETWLINDDAFAQSVHNNKTYTALFNSNGQTFNSIIINNNPMNGGMFYDSTKVVDPDNAFTFIDQAYRTVTFETTPTGELLTWLQANATKQ